MDVQAVFEDGKLRLLESVNLQEGERVQVTILRTEHLSGSDIVELPAEARDRLMREAAERMEADYRDDPDLLV